jgi:branched-chain amino acid aminotransferase
MTAHLERLLHGLHLCGIACPKSNQEISEIAEVVTKHNLRYVGEDDELSIGIGVTAGDSRSQSPAAFPNFRPDISPTSRLVVHAVRLPIEEWRSAYRTGIGLFTSKVQEISGQSVPRSIKSRSRLHYWLAEQDERFVSGRCFPLLLNADGNITEAPTATIVIVDESKKAMIAPELETILHGVTFDYVSTIASNLGLKIERDVISPQKLRQADEVLWLSTPQFVLPVTQMDGKPIANGQPGRRFREILTAIESDFGLELTTL